MLCQIYCNKAGEKLFVELTNEPYVHTCAKQSVTQIECVWGTQFD